MVDDSREKMHWDNVYETKTPEQVSWTEPLPATSLGLIRSCQLQKSAKIIDIGGGDSQLADCLLSDGYDNITVLDISEKALDRARARLGNRSEKIKWVVSDITRFEPTGNYDIWHDRATFHFLTKEEQIAKYLGIAKRCVNGFMIVGTFSSEGPLKCSGLDIRQYNEQSLAQALGESFEKLNCFTEDHITPFNTKQNFLFCRFKRI